CCLVAVVAPLWRDADVQIHPRYLLIALPAALILCASLYERWVGSTRAAVAWVLAAMVAFAVAQLGIQWIRDLQNQKREFVALMVQTVPADAVLIAGGYSPILDYYRGLGVRPGWRIVWSGWQWSRDAVAAQIEEAC